MHRTVNQLKTINKRLRQANTIMVTMAHYEIVTEIDTVVDDRSFNVKFADRLFRLLRAVNDINCTERVCLDEIAFILYFSLIETAKEHSIHDTALLYSSLFTSYSVLNKQRTDRARLIGIMKELNTYSRKVAMGDIVNLTTISRIDYDILFRLLIGFTILHSYINESMLKADTLPLTEYVLSLGTVNDVDKLGQLLTVFVKHKYLNREK